MKISSLLLVLVILGCNSTETSKKETNHPEKSEVGFNPQDFIIGRECLGKIKIGQTISEAEKLLKGFNKKEEEASIYGICGGGNLYSYYQDSNLIFSLLPYDNSDTILNILAIDKRLKTIHGLNPNSSVGDMLKIYPDMKVGISSAYNEEYFFDKKNGWIYEFFTDEKQRIGEYLEDIEEVVKPTNLNLKCSFFIIDKVNEE